MLQSRSILAKKLPTDGERISVMSRHTLPDGKTPDARITPDKFDVHMPIFAAPPEYVGAYYRGELTFDEYAEAYREHLRKHIDDVIGLVQKCKKETITVLCIEDTAEHCHRRILLEFAQELAIILSQPLETKIN